MYEGSIKVHWKLAPHIYRALILCYTYEMRYAYFAMHIERATQTFLKKWTFGVFFQLNLVNHIYFKNCDHLLDYIILREVTFQRKGDGNFVWIAFVHRIKKNQ